MIISHKYKFIFLKTNKTAGTSIEIALSKFCGEDDVITPISREDERTRKKLGYRGPQNYAAPIGDYTVKDWLNLLFLKRKYRFYNHISAAEVKTLIPDEIWRNYYTFCFERNPWERVISQYYWTFRSQPSLTLKEFIASEKIMKLKQRGIDLYTISGEVAVDRVCLFENLHAELERFRIKVGIPQKIVLPRAKAKYRTDKRNYWEIMNEQEKQKVATLFCDEIRMFGYSFESTPESEKGMLSKNNYVAPPGLEPGFKA